MPADFGFVADDLDFQPDDLGFEPDAPRAETLYDQRAAEFDAAQEPEKPFRAPSISEGWQLGNEAAAADPILGAPARALALLPRLKAQTVQDAFDVMTPGLPLDAQSQPPSLAAQRTAGVVNVGRGVADSLASPLGIATLGIGGAPAIAQRAISGAFLADIAASVPELARTAGEASVSGTPQEKVEAYGNLATVPAFAAGIGLHALAPRGGVELPDIPDPAAVARNVIIEGAQQTARDTGLHRTAEALEGVKKSSESAAKEPVALDQVQQLEKPIEAPRATEIDQVAAMPHQDFVTWAREQKGGYTTKAYELGEKMQTPEGAAKLRELEAQTEAARLAAFAAEDIEGAMNLANKKQFFTEALESAVGVAKNKSNLTAEQVAKAKAAPAAEIATEVSKPIDTPVVESEVVPKAEPVVTAEAKAFAPEAASTPREQTLGISPGASGVENLWGKVKSGAQKYFTARGNLPPEAQVAKERMGGQIQAADKEIKQLTRDLRSEVADTYQINPARALLGDFQQVPKEAVQAMNSYLKGELANPEVIPANVRGALDNMRASITGRSKRILEQMAEAGVENKLTETIANNMDVYLARSYRFFDQNKKAPEWYAELPTNIRESAETFVRERAPDLSPDQARSNLLNWLSDLKDNSGKGRGKLGSKDLSQFMRRKQIAPEIRAVLGEHTDPVINYARSVTKMADWSARQEFLTKVKSQGLGQWLFTEADAPPGFNARIAAEGSEAMSPLDGLRTTPEIAEAFSSLGKQNNPGAIAKIYFMANALTKQAATTQSLLTQMRNLTSQPFFWGMSGHWKMGELGPTLKAIGEDLGLAKDSAWREYIKDAAEHGIVGDTARATELREILKDAAMSETPIDNLSAFSWAKLVKKAAFDIPGEIYKVSDELGKIYGWQNERAILRRIHPEWSETQIKAQAAERVRNMYPTYSKVPEAVKQLRKVPVVGPFVSFPYEVIRTSFHSLGRSLSEIRSSNPTERAIGAKRLASQMATIGATTALGLISRQMAGVSGKEEEDLRRFQPPWSRNSQYFFLDKDKDGKVKFVNLSYQNPYSYLTDPAVSVASSVKNDEPFTKAVARTMGEFLRPFVSEQMLAAALMDVARNTTDTGRPVYNPQDEPEVKATKISDHILSTLLPGSAQRFRKRIGPSLTGDQSSTGRKLEPATEITAELTGLRLENFDFNNGLSFKARQYGRDLQDAQNILRTEANKRGARNQDTLDDAWKDSQEAQKRLWDEMREDYLAVLRSGVSQQEAIKTLLGSGLSQMQAGSVLSGKYLPWMPGAETLNRITESGRKITIAPQKPPLQLEPLP